MEIQTRQRLIRLGMSRMDACLKFMDLLFTGDINRLAEGTAPPIQLYEPTSEKFDREAVTLVIEILDPEGSEENPSPAPSTPQPAATRRPGLGFPSL